MNIIFQSQVYLILLQSNEIYRIAFTKPANDIKQICQRIRINKSKVI